MASRRVRALERKVIGGLRDKFGQPEISIPETLLDNPRRIVFTVLENKLPDSDAVLATPPPQLTAPAPNNQDMLADAQALGREAGQRVAQEQLGQALGQQPAFPVDQLAVGGQVPVNVPPGRPPFLPAPAPAPDSGATGQIPQPVSRLNPFEEIR